MAAFLNEQQRLSFQLHEAMCELHPENLGPESEFSQYYSDYEDLHRAVSTLAERQILPPERCTAENVREVVRGVNEHFTRIIDEDDDDGDPIFPEIYRGQAIINRWPGYEVLA